jgi:hypothetical protein
MSKHQFGGVAIGIGIAMLTVLNFNGVNPTLRGILSVIFTIVLLFGLACFHDLVPAKYRGRGWAVRRLAELHSERELLEEPTPMPGSLLMADESDVEAFDMRPGAQNFGPIKRARRAPLDRTDLRLLRKLDIEIAELNERLKRPTLRASLRGLLTKWKR